MLAGIKTTLKKRFFSTKELSALDYKRSQRRMIMSGSTSSIINMLTSGSFLVGYLTYLGASVQYCAIMGAIPQLGCILQMFSPYLFERLKHRKLLICLSCFLFRFSVGTIIIVPYMITNRETRLAVIMIIYTFAFLVAGFVTPGLNNWYLDMAPEDGRGKFLALKDIVSMLSVSVSSLLIGKMLDHFSVTNGGIIGFTIMFALAMLLSIVDLAVIGKIEEPNGKNKVMETTLWQLIMIPLKDVTFRKFILFLSIWNFAVQFSVSCIPIFMLTSLKLSYSFISAVSVAGNVCGMISVYLWGRLADRTSWKFVIRACGTLMALCYFGWFLVTPNNAKVMVALLQIVMICCGGAFHMASTNIQYNASSDTGKTAYFGVTSAIACVISFIGALLGSFVLKVIEGMELQLPYIQVEEIQVLFLTTSLLLVGALLLFMRNGKSNH